MLGNLRLVRIAHHPIDAIESRQFLRRALGVAAGDQDLGVRILATNPANGLPRVGIRAGVTVQVFRTTRSAEAASRNRAQAAILKRRLNTSAVGLRGAAPETVYKNCFHENSNWELWRRRGMASPLHVPRASPFSFAHL